MPFALTDIVEKSDLFRLLLLYHEGGFYQDIDRPYNRPLREVLSNATRVLLPLYVFDFVQDMMCSAPRNPLLLRAVQLNLERRRELAPRRSNRTGFLEAHDVYRLGPVTWYHAVTETLFGERFLPDRQPFLHFPLVRPIVVATQIMKYVTPAVKEQAPLILAHFETACHTMVYQASHGVCNEEALINKHKVYARQNVSHWVSATEHSDDPSELKAGVEVAAGIACVRQSNDSSVLGWCDRCTRVECEYDCLLKMAAGKPCRFISYDAQGGAQGRPKCLLHRECKLVESPEGGIPRVGRDLYTGHLVHFWNYSDVLARFKRAAQERKKHPRAKGPLHIA